jgi:hypothetical protein
MLAMNQYPKDYIAGCRARVDAQVAAFHALSGATRRAKSPGPAKALEAAESAFYNNMVIVLEGYFVHRTRGMEGRDGNPLNEVRILAHSMMDNGDRTIGDSNIRMNPARTVLKHAVGDPIALSEADFRLLSAAFFAEIEKKYG